MTDIPNCPSLWREIDRAWWSLVDTANPHASPPASDQAACVIRAMRDWLVPEELEPAEPVGYGIGADCGEFTDQWARWHDRQHLRALLTTEADRAERGDD